MNFDGKEYTNEQYAVIEQALKDKCNPKLMDYFLKPTLSAWQMNEVRMAIKDGITDHFELSLLANTNLQEWQLDFMRIGFENKLDFQDVYNLVYLGDKPSEPDIRTPMFWSEEAILSLANDINAFLNSATRIFSDEQQVDNSLSIFSDIKSGNVVAWEYKVDKALEHISTIEGVDGSQYAEGRSICDKIRNFSRAEFSRSSSGIDESKISSLEWGNKRNELNHMIKLKKVVESNRDYRLYKAPNSCMWVVKAVNGGRECYCGLSWYKGAKFIENVANMEKAKGNSLVASLNSKVDASKCSGNHTNMKEHEHSR